jgi:biotin operon repressor
MEQNDSLLKFCKALADESRLKIVGLLASCEHNVQQMAAALGLKEPTVSHHLSVLKDVGLAKVRIEGNVHWYRLDGATLRTTSRLLFDRERLAAFASAGSDSRSSDQKVLAHYLNGERLTKIPDVRKKRYVVLKWLAGYFAEGAEYSEAEVNAILKAHHEDVATLRREMIGYRIFERDKGRYRRLPQSDWRNAEA